MFRLIAGIPSRWLLALLATLLGGTAVAGTGTVVIVLAASQGEVLPLVLETPVEAMPAAPFVSPIKTITPTVTPTITVTSTPTATVTPTSTVVPTKPGISGLAFHPGHLNAAGKCSEVYSANGSLKNHGPALATGVEITYEIVGEEEWVESVEVTPAQWDELDTSKPGRFTVYVHTTEGWASAGKGARIEVRLYLAGEQQDAEAIFAIKNQCKEEKPEKPEKPIKPENPDKPEKTPKPEKSVKPEKPETPRPDKPKPEKPAKPEKPPKPKKTK